MGRNDQAWPVFRCSLLSPLVLGEIPVADREAYFHTLAQEERLLPNGKRKRISVRTLRRWWQRLQREGVQGTARRPRNDRGQPRRKLQPLLERAIALKKEQPRRSAVVLNRILRTEFGRAVPRSTLYRHLRLQGATRRKLGISQEKIRCRWTRDQARRQAGLDFASAQARNVWSLTSFATCLARLTGPSKIGSSGVQYLGCEVHSYPAIVTNLPSTVYFSALSWVSVHVSLGICQGAVLPKSWSLTTTKSSLATSRAWTK